MQTALDAVDRRLLDAVQCSVPLVPRPFAALGEAVGLGEAAVIERLAALRAGGVLRQIGAIFDTPRLGYRSCLVAARVAPERVEEAARVIGEHPGVSHCYLRDHDWNLWFTLAVPPDSALGLAGTAEHLAREAGLESTRLLPALRVFKIGVQLAMGDGAGEVAPAAPGSSAGLPGTAAGRGLTARERAVVVALQEPLSLVREPFEEPARAAGMTVAALLAGAEALRAEGFLRRFAAVLHHRRAGYGANVMGVWAVPAARVEEVGARIAAFPAVSHCYERPTSRDWPYSLFSMVHGRSREECVATLDAIAAATGITEHAALWSLREFKKVRLRYFTPDYAGWDARALEARAHAEPPGYPIILRLAGRRVVVVGGGEIAERKIEGLLEAGARVTVVSPDVTRRIAAWAAAGAVALERRRYETGDLSDSALAYAATDDEAANRAVGEEAEAKGVWLNVVDRPARCGFFAPAVVRRGDLSIAISTNGASPALARRLRERLEQQLGPEYARALETLRAERRRLLREEPDPARRREALEALLDALGLP